jgi:hypothetical protein
MSVDQIIYKFTTIWDFIYHHYLQICPFERMRLTRLSNPNHFRLACTYLNA